MNKQSTTLYIVRHGQSHTNVSFDEDRQPIITSLGTELTIVGKKQVKTLSEKFTHISFVALFSSHLLRAKRTAEIIAKERKLPVIVKEALQERQLGNLLGKSQLELEKTITDFFENSEEKTLPERWRWKLSDDMESEEEAVGRFITVIREISLIYPGKTILVVTHGQIMRSFLVYLGFASFNELPYGSIVNTGYIVVETDGNNNFFLKETYGITKKAFGQ